MAKHFKTRQETISAYADALREDSTCRKAAEILYNSVGILLSMDNVTRETKILSLAQEIDNILRGSIEAQRGGAVE